MIKPVYTVAPAAFYKSLFLGHPVNIRKSLKGDTLPPNSVHASTTLESSVSREWEAANAEKDDIKRSKQIAELLNKIPKGNKTNIEFLFDFLARLNGEEVF